MSQGVEADLGPPGPTSGPKILLVGQAALHLGLVITAIGLWLPWTRVGGENRSGFSTSNLLLTLSNDGLPDFVGWIAQAWYLAAFLALVGWVAATIGPRPWMALLAVLFFVVGSLIWIPFAVVARNEGLLDVQLLGPVTAILGLMVMVGGATTVGVSRRQGRRARE